VVPHLKKGYIKIARTTQDGTACAGNDDPVKVCRTCGVLYDSAHPLNAASL
jgi:hypothetical protein